MTSPAFRAAIALILCSVAAACSTPRTNPPSLAPRAAEKIDPRLPVERTTLTKPVATGLDARLAALLAKARSGEAAFRAALGPAQRAVAAAGPAHGEKWIAAQQRLSALEATRQETAGAVADLEALAGVEIKSNNGIGTQDLAAIQAASAEASAIEEAQRRELAAISALLAD